MNPILSCRVGGSRITLSELSTASMGGPAPQVAHLSFLWSVGFTW